MTVHRNQPGAGDLLVGEVSEGWSADAAYHEYTKAADPLTAGTISAVPAERFGASLHTAPGTRVVPLDLSHALGVRWAATAPGLLASFVRIEAGETLDLRTTGTSELLFVMSGSGSSGIGGREMSWAAGDFLALPASTRAGHRATTTSVLYRVDDSPLLAYLGAAAVEPRFEPTRHPAAEVSAQLDVARAAPGADERNRIAILLANRAFPQTLTVTHTLWAMYGVLPAGRVQRPHRHQSVALDLIVDCPPGCYSLLGRELDPDSGAIVDPVRVDWEAGGAFVTPPGLWHSHHNDSGTDAFLVPVQDAGLHTHLRTLDIRFT